MRLAWTHASTNDREVAGSSPARCGAFAAISCETSQCAGHAAGDLRAFAALRCACEWPACLSEGLAGPGERTRNLPSGRATRRSVSLSCGSCMLDASTALTLCCSSAAALLCERSRSVGHRQHAAMSFRADPECDLGDATRIVRYARREWTVWHGCRDNPRASD